MTDARSEPIPRSLIAWLVLVSGLCVDGAGIWMAGQVGQVSVGSNAIVWIGIGHAIYCVIVSIWIWSGMWDWRASHFGAASLVVVAPGYFLLSSYLAIAFYSNGGVLLRVCLVLALVAVYGWQIHRAVSAYALALNDPKIHAMIYRESADRYIYSQRDDVRVREKFIKLDINPSIIGMASGVFGCVLTFFFREEVYSSFGVSFLPVAVAVMGFVMGGMFFSFAAIAIIVFFVHPFKLRRMSGKLVYVNLAGNPASSR